MTFIAYLDKRFTRKSQQRIVEANAIIAEYQAEDLSLTLRQLFYQFVARDLLPNTQRDYKNLGTLINDARYAGQVSWTAIEDRTRTLRGTKTHNTAQDALQALAEDFAYDLWKDQEVRIEVWIEKDALLGVIERICNELRVNYFSCRGYVSASEMWRGATRFVHYGKKMQRIVILHLGDHDPSGMQMTEDINDRTGLLSGYGPAIEVRRIALNMDQIEEHNPPPNAAKLTDPRADRYIREYGYESWELDALDPRTLRDLIRDHVDRERDDTLFDEALEREEATCERIREFAEGWEEDA